MNDNEAPHFYDQTAAIEDVHIMLALALTKLGGTMTVSEHDVDSFQTRRLCLMVKYRHEDSCFIVSLEKSDIH